MTSNGGGRRCGRCCGVLKLPSDRTRRWMVLAAVGGLLLAFVVLPLCLVELAQALDAAYGRTYLRKICKVTNITDTGTLQRCKCRSPGCRSAFPCLKVDVQLLETTAPSGWSDATYRLFDDDHRDHQSLRHQCSIQPCSQSVSANTEEVASFKEEVEVEGNLTCLLSRDDPPIIVRRRRCEGHCVMDVGVFGGLLALFVVLFVMITASFCRCWFVTRQKQSRTGATAAPRQVRVSSAFTERDHGEETAVQEHGQTPPLKSCEAEQCSTVAAVLPLAAGDHDNPISGDSDPRSEVISPPRSAGKEVADSKAPSPFDGIKQFFVTVDENDAKIGVMKNLKHILADTQTVVYVNSSEEVEPLAAMLSRDLVYLEVWPFHSGLDSFQRHDVMKAFREHSGGGRVLVTSDSWGRGVVTGDISITINYSLPPQVDSYLVRCANTTSGENSVEPPGKKQVINFVLPHQLDILKEIEKRFNTKIYKLPISVAYL